MELTTPSRSDARSEPVPMSWIRLIRKQSVCHSENFGKCAQNIRISPISAGDYAAEEGTLQKKADEKGKKMDHGKNHGKINGVSRNQLPTKTCTGKLDTVPLGPQNRAALQSRNLP